MDRTPRRSPAGPGVDEGAQAEVLGVNDRSQLARAEEQLAREKRTRAELDAANLGETFDPSKLSTRYAGAEDSGPRFLLYVDRLSNATRRRKWHVRLY